MHAAVESILEQTLADLELIIVDDASVDDTREEINRSSDERVQLLLNDRPLGLAASLNRALTATQGRYVARLDADDLALRHRLAVQANFLDEHPRISIVGSQATMIDENGNVVGGLNAPVGRLAVLWELLLGPPFIHPTVMLRRDSFERLGLRFDPMLPAAQDYQLWSRALAHVQGDNIAESLVLYRKHDRQTTAARRTAQLEIHDQIALSVIRREVPELSLGADAVGALRRFAVGGGEPDRPVHELVELYFRLFDAFSARHGNGDALADLRHKVAERALRRTLQISPGVRAVAGIVRRDPQLLGLVLRLLKRRVGRLARQLAVE